MNEPKQIPGFIGLSKTFISDIFGQHTVGDWDAEARLIIRKRSTHVRHAVGMVRLEVRWR